MEKRPPAASVYLIALWLCHSSQQSSSIQLHHIKGSTCRLPRPTHFDFPLNGPLGGPKSRRNLLLHFRLLLFDWYIQLVDRPFVLVLTSPSWGDSLLSPRRFQNFLKQSSCNSGYVEHGVWFRCFHQLWPVPQSAASRHFRLFP